MSGAWLAMAVSGPTQHGGNDGYIDDPETTYEWDSTVPNHGVVAVGDIFVMWDKVTLLGCSVIEAIDIGSRSKQLFRCPQCGKAGIKRRFDGSYRCHKCKHQFDTPVKIDALVTTYRSQHGAGWVDMAGALDGSTLRASCISPRSQLSIRAVDFDRLQNELAACSFDVELGSILDVQSIVLGGGHDRRVVRVRRGQAGFRAHLLRKFGECCAVTGPAPLVTLEAAHLYSFAEIGKHEDAGGLILRSDIHKLFDRGLLAVDPISLQINLSPSIRTSKAYAGLQGSRLIAKLGSTERRWLQAHWDQHRSAE